jgi:hypothetical protein
MAIRLSITCDAARRAMRLVSAVSILCVVTTTADSRRLVAQDAAGRPQANFRNAPPGRLVDVGGYRLHLNCSGYGPPTVVLAAGAGDYSIDWALVS